VVSSCLSLPLDGGSFAYTIQFTKDQLPEYKRFWSMTAYTRQYIELVPNTLDKYVVASYTPGLVTAPEAETSRHTLSATSLELNVSSAQLSVRSAKLNVESARLKGQFQGTEDRVRGTER
jgi:hypothetical protein